MADLHDRAPHRRAFDLRDFRQYRIADGLEGLRDKCGADDSGRIARTQRNHAPAPALRHGQRNQIAHQIHDVPEIVVEADALDDIAADRLAVLPAQPDWPADAGVILVLFRHRRRYDAFAELSLDQHVRLAVRSVDANERADIEGGVRPRRLGQVFDNAGEVAVALDQKDITRLERFPQCRRIAGRERLISLHRLFQIPTNRPRYMAEH